MMQTSPMKEEVIEWDRQVSPVIAEVDNENIAAINTNDASFIKAKTRGPHRFFTWIVKQVIPLWCR